MRILTIVLLFPLITHSQSVLHYSETSGFDHNTRSASLAMFQILGQLDNYALVDDTDGSEFDALINLMQYDVVVFSNTSGDGILDSNQRANFEAYIAAGGNVLGIHAASDTYRHTSANGGSTGTWDFYAETLGASVQQSPNHVAGTPSYAMGHIGLHQSTANLPDPWQKNEEYYYWENGYFDSTNTSVLQVEETVGPNGLVNNYDSARAISWYRILSSGSKVFYTALGHAQSNFSGDTLFRRHIRDAMLWLLGSTTSIGPTNSSHWVKATQVNAALQLTWSADWGRPTALTVYSNTGVAQSWQTQGPGGVIALNLPTGIYHLSAVWDEIEVFTSFSWVK